MEGSPKEEEIVYIIMKICGKTGKGVLNGERNGKEGK